MKKIILYNPHLDDFLGEPPHFRLLQRRPLKKYGFLINALIKEQGKLSVIVDGTISCFISPIYFRKLPKFIRVLISLIEYKVWVNLNEIEKIERISVNCKSLKSYTLLVFSYKAAIGNFVLRQNLFNAFGDVCFHLSHYFVSTKEKSENIKKIENVWLAGDSDLSHNDYFNTYFSWYKKEFITLPFAVKSRFVDRTPLFQREPRCVATGSVHNLRQEMPVCAYKDYIDQTGFDTYHPLRKEIYENRDKVSRYIECLVTPYRTYLSSSVFTDWISHYFVAQKKYLALDIVEIYNKYKFAVIGEEASGFPALGMFEAMACGCIVFADSKRLHGLGLEADIHYIQYDGSLKGLLSAISATVNRHDLDLISSAGKNIIQLLFSENNVGLAWIEKINSYKK